MANATPALQAASAATQSIPILGTSVTEYGTALEIKDFSGTVGGNVSGTSDLAPLNEQAKMFPELLPNAKNIGLVYCSAEANSAYQIKVVKAELEKLGLTCKEYAFSDSNDIATICESACAENDAIYIPTDNKAGNFRKHCRRSMPCSKSSGNRRRGGYLRKMRYCNTFDQLL